MGMYKLWQRPMLSCKICFNSQKKFLNIGLLKLLKLWTMIQKSQSIIQRLARGDLSHFDAAMEMSRSAPDELLKDDVELQSYFDKMEKDVNDDEKIHEAYESMKKNPNLKDVMKKNSKISKMMKDEDSFKKHMKASFDLNKKSTESAM